MKRTLALAVALVLAGPVIADAKTAKKAPRMACSINVASIVPPKVWRTHQSESWFEEGWACQVEFGGILGLMPGDPEWVISRQFVQERSLADYVAGVPNGLSYGCEDCESPSPLRIVFRSTSAVVTGQIANRNRHFAARIQLAPGRPPLACIVQVSWTADDPAPPPPPGAFTCPASEPSDPTR